MPDNAAVAPPETTAAVAPPETTVVFVTPQEFTLAGLEGRVDSRTQEARVTMTLRPPLRRGRRRAGFFLVDVDDQRTVYEVIVDADGRLSLKSEVVGPARDADDPAASEAR